MKKQNEVTVVMVYDLVDKTRIELTARIDKLSNAFDTLEAGRLSTLESRFASLEGRIFATAGVIGFVISLGVSIGSKLIK